MSSKKEKQSIVKRILKWGISIFLVLLIALISIPYLFKDKIVAMVSKTINENINATVTFNEVDLSLLRNFPNASLGIDNIGIVNKAPFLGDTLFYAEKLNINLKITELLKKPNETLSIDRISTSNGQLNIRFNKQGIGNYDIAIKEEVKTQVDTTANSNFSFDFEEYELENIDFKFVDEASQMVFSLDEIHHTGKGNFASDILDVDTQTATNVSLEMEKTNYLDKVPVRLQAVIAIDLNAMKFSFKENTGYINQLPLAFDGFLQLMDEKQRYDINFTTPTSSFKNALALLPKQYAGNLDAITTKGNFDLKGEVKGVLSNTTIPTFNISLVSNNAMFKYADLPKAVTNIFLNTHIINQTGHLKDTYVRFKKASFQIDEDVFNANGNIANITTNPTIDLTAKGSVNLGNIHKAYPMATNQKLEGVLKADVTTNFNMETIDKGNYQNIKNKGTVSLANFKYEGTEVAHPFKIDNTSITFNSNTIKLNEFKAKTGSSDLNLHGDLENFYGFLFKNQQLKGTFNLLSTNFKVDDFLTSDQTDDTNTATTETSTSRLKIPSFLNITLHTKAKNVIYDNINLSNVAGSLSIKDESVSLKNVTSDVFGGNIGFTGNVNTKGDRSKFNMDLDLKKLNISEAFGSLDMLQSIAPIAKSVVGKINSTINLSGYLGDDMTPDVKTLTGDLLGQLLNTKLQPKNSNMLSLLGTKVDFLDINKLNLHEATALLSFKEGNVILKPFKTRYNDIDIQLSGNHSLDNSMNYKILFDLPVKYLGTEVTTALAKLTPKDAATIKTVPVNAILTGNFSNPRFSSDLKTATTDLMTSIIEKQKQSLIQKGKEELTNKLTNLLTRNSKKDSVKKDPVKDTKDKVKNVLNGLFGKKK